MTRASLSHAATLGLCLGLLVAGVALLLLAARAKLTDFDCGGLSPSECALELQIARQFARWQLLLGAALALLGGGGLWWERNLERRREASDAEARPPQPS